MACCIRIALLALPLLAMWGCLAGHLLDAARRREEVQAYRAVLIDGDRLVVRYLATEKDEAGETRAERECWAAVPLADLRPESPPTLESIHVERLAEPKAVPNRPQLPLQLAGAADATPAPSARVMVEDGRHVALQVCPADAACYAPLPSGALTRVRTEPWAYPLLPFLLAVDAVGDPILLFFAPAVMAIGD